METRSDIISLTWKLISSSMTYGEEITELLLHWGQKKLTCPPEVLTSRASNLRKKRLAGYLGNNDKVEKEKKREQATRSVT